MRFYTVSSIERYREPSIKLQNYRLRTKVTINSRYKLETSMHPVDEWQVTYCTFGKEIGRTDRRNFNWVESIH